MFQLSKRFGFSSNQYVWNIPIGRQLEFSSLSLSEWKWRPVALRHFTILRAERNIFFSTGILNFTFASFDRLPSHFNNWNNCFENFIWNVSVSGFEKLKVTIFTVLWTKVFTVIKVTFEALKVKLWFKYPEYMYAFEIQTSISNFLLV